MKKFGLALAVLLIFGIVVIVAMVTSGDDRPGADEFRDRVIGVALGDPAVQEFINFSDKKAEPEYIKPGDTGVYVYNSTRYAGISFNGNSGFRPISLKVVVDTSTMRVMGLFYSGFAPLMNSSVIIPPGNGIYDTMYGSFNLTWPNKYFVPEIGRGAYSLDVSPSDARLYPMIVNGDGLAKLINGTAYDVPELIDPQTGDRVKIDGGLPLGSLRDHYILPPEIQSYRVDDGINTPYYLVLLNGDDRDVKVQYRAPAPPLYVYDLPVPTP